MKRMRVIAPLLALVLLCCACSAAAGEGTRADTGLAVPLRGSAEAPGFTGIPAGAWYAEAADWCKEHEILTGTAFDADRAMTRAAVAEALYRAEGSPAVQDPAGFSDIPAGADYAGAAAWAASSCVISGYGGGRFGGEDPVTREQMAAILWRYAGSPAAGPGEDFADEDSIAGFAGTAVDWARASGVINGTDGGALTPRGA